MRDRTKQITLDFTKYPKAKEIYDNISGSKVAWVADAIEEKHEREKGIVFTPEQEELIDQKDKNLYKMITDWVHKYYIRKDDKK